ncbi:MAG: chemotaxis protein CheD [Hyphomicrobiales bacterium]|nr:MAG: chemotaxis protein CheD [Hyphomicrobiales bacterium]
MTLTVAAPATRRITIIQGEYRVTDDPNVCFTTILGSCAAACIRDPEAKVGGLNHFLLPGDPQRAAGKDAERYGVYLMELLINGLMQKGAKRSRLEAKLFGGARTMMGLSDIGAMNRAFAEEFLQNEGIALMGGHLGGDRGRRIEYWPVSGRARQVLFSSHAKVETMPPPPPAASTQLGDVDLF